SFVTANVRGNDSDPDTSDVLSVVGLNTAGTLGTVTDNGNGTFTYDPNGAFDYLEAGQTATDTFSYTIDDGNGGTDTATVTIRIDGANDAPVANPDAAGVNEGGAVNIDLGGNDTDADDGIDPASISIVSGPSNGTLVINTDGTVDYTHNGSETTTDGFTYRINDLSGTNSNVATVDIAVNPQNDAPVAGDDAYSTKNDTTLTVNITDGVQANDSDAENDPLDTTVVAGPANGTVTLNANGSFTYTPNAGFFGTDSLTYKANDGAINSNDATVTIEVKLNTLPPTVDVEPDPEPEEEEKATEDPAPTTTTPPTVDPDPPPNITPTPPAVDARGDDGPPRILVVDEVEQEEDEPSNLLQDFGKPDIRDPRYLTPPQQGLEIITKLNQQITLFGAYEFFEQLDSLEDLMNSQTVMANVTAGSAGVISLGLSAGYAFVTIRAGTLVTSLLTSMPAWRVVDPLPVLAYLNDEDDDDLDAAEKNETLESIVAGAGIKA
ncbi:MAG: cadherin-like domain-containing protein, partial [Planctomycetota bacterium]|nr:cadherin-like domain-containing protein [Planctomycetota bacterium]